MLVSLQLFNAIMVRVKQKPEGYCSVVDILFSWDLFWQFGFTSSLAVFFGVRLIASQIRSMAKMAALGVRFELPLNDSRIVGHSEPLIGMWLEAK
jgi:hypothetical protein